MILRSKKANCRQEDDAQTKVNKISGELRKLDRSEHGLATTFGGQKAALGIRFSLSYFGLTLYEGQYLGLEESPACCLIEESTESMIKMPMAKRTH